MSNNVSANEASVAFLVDCYNANLFAESCGY
jgi:hypothetical protein